MAAYPAGEPPAQRSTLADRPPRPIDGAFLTGPVEEAAQALLGVLIVRDDEAGRRVARIVETEAYAGPEDRASHARAGRTPRNDAMFGPPGHAYVYLVYGLHHCLNVVCGPEGQAAAVLVRAIEPIDGTELMRARRGAAAGADERLGAGPARTCQALAIDLALDGIDLLSDARLWLAGPSREGAPLRDRERVVAGPRVGVAYAGPEWAARMWRFGIAGHPSLSRPFPTLA